MDVVKTRRYGGIVALCVAIALVAGVAAGAGVFLRGDGSTATGTSIRGEQYQYATTGVYRWNAERIVAEGVGWDVLTLFVAVPMLLLALPGVARGSLRSRLLAIGVLGYLWYQYLMYAMFWALGPLFPVFIVLFPACAAAIVWIVTTIDVSSLPAAFGERLPRHAMAGFSFFIGGMLVLMWSQRIATGLSGDLAGAGLLGSTTLSVQALDLGVIVPLAIVTGVTALKRMPVSYLLVPAFAVKGVSMSAAICAMLVSAWMVEGALEVGPFALFGGATLVAGGLAWASLRHAPGAVDAVPTASDPAAGSTQTAGA